MRILYITAGAAGMYCGSCLIDNALAAELIRRGHDVSLVPLYTPTLTDETNVSQRRVFFGGLSVYLEQYSKVFRHTPWLLDRLWDSASVIRAFSGRTITPNPEMLGALTVSMLQGENGNQRKELKKLLHWLRSQAPPDVVHLQSSLLFGLVGPVRAALNRPVFVTLQGEDWFLEQLKSPFKQEALQILQTKAKTVDVFVSYTNSYAERMAALLGTPRAKIKIVPMGLNLAEFQHQESLDFSEPLKVGYFARIAPEKGLDLLCEAYRILRQTPGMPKTRLDVAGYLAPEHETYLASLEARMRSWGLASEFRYHGSLGRAEKLQFIRQLNVFSVPVRFEDPKGLPVLEAMASGVPVVQPKRGAFCEILNKASGGILVEPESAESLANGLRSVLVNRDLRRQLSERGREGVSRFHSISGMAEQTLKLYQASLAT